MMTKTMFVNSQQFLFIILFICEVITLHKVNMIAFISFYYFSSFFILFPQDHGKITKTLDSTLIFIIYNSQTQLRREIIKQNSKLDHAINFILLDQDTTNRIELRKTVKIGV